MSTVLRPLTSRLLLGPLLYQPLAQATAEREAWLDRMSTMFCQPTQYFRACCSVSVQQYEESTASATRVCIRQHPDSVPDPMTREDATRFGGILGSCAGTAYEAVLVAQRTSNERCDDPDNWR